MDYNYTFDNFILYEGNEFAHAAMYEVSHHPDKPMSPLYLYSRPGLGKSHLVKAAANQLEEGGKVTYIIVTTAEQFRTEYIYACSTRNLFDFYEKYECADVLMMENLPHLSKSKELQQAFNEILDMFQRKNKQVILTGDVSPAHLKDFDKSLLSKILSGYIIEIGMPGFDDRIAILHGEMEMILAEKKINIDSYEQEEIFSLIANLEAEDIRLIKGMLANIIGFSMICEEQIDLALAKKILRSR